MLQLIRIKRTDKDLLLMMENHYSKPKGFVGRNICYKIIYNGTIYGAIVAGSATRFLPGRDEFFGYEKGAIPLNNIINNIFYHIEPVGGKYPIRNFTIVVLQYFQNKSSEDWEAAYGDRVIGFESLVELPRKGNIYLRDKWTKVGETIGYTCKRTSGIGTDSWSGKRVWDTKNLRPKSVFVKWRNK